MKLSLKQVAQSIEPMQMLLKERVPAAGGFLLSRNWKALREANEDYNKQRVAILELNNVPKGNDGKYDMGSLSGEATAEIEQEHGELLDTEIDVPIANISIDKLGDAAPPVVIFEYLDWMFTE